MGTRDTYSRIFWGLLLSFAVFVGAIALLTDRQRPNPAPDDGTVRMSSAENADARSDWSPTPTHDVRYVHSMVNVRAGPGTNHEVKYQVGPGDRIYTETGSGWRPVFYRRSSRDTSGWIAGRLLRSSPPPDLHVLSVSSEVGEYGNSYATGRIRNTTDRTYSYVQVEINLYGPGGNVVGSTLDNVTNLGPGQTWRFRAVMMGENVERFRVEDVTGY